MSSSSDSITSSYSESEPNSYDSESFSLVARFLPSAEDKPKDVSEQRIFKTPKEKALSEGIKIAKALEPFLEQKDWNAVPEQLTSLQNWYEKSKKFFKRYPKQYLFALSTAKIEINKLESDNKAYKELSKMDAKGFNTAKMFLKKLDKDIMEAIDDYDANPAKYEDDEESTESEASDVGSSESEEEAEIREDGLDLARIYSFFGLKRETEYEKAKRELEEERERLLNEIRKDSRLPILSNEEFIKKLNKINESGGSSVVSEGNLRKEYGSLITQTIEKHLQLIIITEQMGGLLSPLTYITRLISKESTEKLFRLFDAVLRMLIEDAREGKYNETVIKAAKVKILGKEIQPHTLLSKLVSNSLLLAESVERSLQTDDVRAKEFQINLSHISNVFCILRVLSVLMKKTQEHKQEGRLLVTRNSQVKQNESDMEQSVRSNIVKLNYALQSICYSLTEKQFRLLTKNCFNIQARYSHEFSRDFEEGTIMQLNEEPIKLTSSGASAGNKGPKVPIAIEVKARFTKPPRTNLDSLLRLYPEANINTSLVNFSRRCLESVLRNTPSDGRTLTSAFFTESELARDRVQSLLMHITTMCNSNILDEGLALFQNSNVSSHINSSDPRTQILYNRAILSIGLCAFKKGKFHLSKEALSELAFPFLKPKQLLGQRFNENNQMNSGNVKQKTELENLLIKKALIPTHLHIQTDLIEIVSFLSCVFLDAPTLASYVTSGAVSTNYGRQLSIGRSLWSIYQYKTRSELIDGVDSSRGIMSNYCRAILKGDWKLAIVSLDRLVPVIYKGLHDDGQKSSIDGKSKRERLYDMLCEKTKYVALECYLIICNNTTSTLDIAALGDKFDINQSVLIDYLRNRSGRQNYSISDDGTTVSVTHLKTTLTDTIRQVNEI